MSLKTMFMHKNEKQRYLAGQVALAVASMLIGVAPAKAALDVDEQNASASDEKTAAPQTVVIKGTGYDARREEASTRIVVKQSELARFGTTSLTETLTRLPGITVTNTGAIAMRGLGEGYVQILLNGEPLPTGVSLDTISPELIERVEILRAGTADIGTRSIAGTINIILKKESKAEQRELKLGVQGGHNLKETNLNVQRSGSNGGLSYALGATALAKEQDAAWTEDYTGYDSLETVDLLHHRRRVTKQHQEIVGLAPRISYSLDSGGIVTLQSFLNAERVRRREDDRIQTSLGAPPPHSSDQARSRNVNWVLRNNLSLQQQFASGAKLDLKSGVTTNRRNTKFDQQGYTLDQEQNRDTIVTSQIHEDGWTSTGKYSRTVFDGHAIALGWDGSRVWRTETRVENALAFPGVPPVDTDQNYSATIGRLALYAQDEWAVGSGLSFYLGVRWEGLETSSKGNEFAPVRSRSGIFFPVFQTVWKIPGSKTDQLRVAATRTYNPPEVAKLIPRLHTSLNNSAVYPDRQGNPALRPEVAMGLDAAYEHYWSDNGMASVSVYAREIDNFIREDVSLIGDRWLVTNINAGKARTHGIEFDIKLPLRTIFPAARSVDLTANLTRNWSSVDHVPGPNNRISGQIRLSGTAGIDYRAPDGKTTAGASFRFKSVGRVRVAYNESEYSSVRRELDIYASRKLDPKSQLRLSLLNLLHQPTWITYGYIGPDNRLDEYVHHPTWTSLRLTLERQF